MFGDALTDCHSNSPVSCRHNLSLSQSYGMSVKGARSTRSHLVPWYSFRVDEVKGKLRDPKGSRLRGEREIAHTTPYSTTDGHETMWRR